MYPTSQVFKDNIGAPIRTTTARVTFDISDVSAHGDVTSIVTSAESPISDKSQLIDKRRALSANIATLETNRFRLDGSFSFADDTLANNGEVGFCSSALCGSDGTFSPFVTITFTFGSTHSSAGLTITFDTTNNEYATDFTVTAYNAADAVIDTVDVTGNADAVTTPLGQLANYKKIAVTIKKWNVGDRRARVLEVDFGFVKVYQDNLVNMGLIEQLDLSTGQLPSAEFDFVVDNSDRAFNILNPTGFYAFLQQRQQVIAEIGLDVGGGFYEYIPIGNYLLWTWNSDEGSLTASFTARTNLDLMASFDYENLVATPKTIYQLAVDLFAICSISNYSIDTALQAITTNALVKKKNCRDVLQMVAIAGCAVVYVTRDNVITLKVNPGSMPAAGDTIDLDNMYQEPQIALDPVVKQVDVTYWTDLDTSAVVTATSSATAGDTLKLEENTLINTSGRATAVANWILSMRGYRAIYQANWRGNPAHELNDVVAIENSYGVTLGAYVTKNEIKFDGALSARTEAKGVVS